MARLGSVCVLLTFGLFAAVSSGCGVHSELDRYSLEACRDSLNARSSAELEDIKKQRRHGQCSRRTLAIIGDGIAGTAAAVNLEGRRIRVYGDSSFWMRLVGIPEVWQTSLAGPFREAGLPLARETPGRRIRREEVLRANWEGLVRSGADYVTCGRVGIAPDGDSAWTLTEASGQRIEKVVGPLILATGTLTPVTIVDRHLASEKTRASLDSARRVVSGDDFLSDQKQLTGQVIGILGAAGSAADCVVAAFRRGASEVIVWGPIDTALVHAPAFDSLVAQYGKQICHINDKVHSVTFDGHEILINGVSEPICNNPSRQGQAVPPVDLLVESLGRDTRNFPREVRQAAAGRRVAYHPVTDHDGALISVRVTFEPTTPQSSPPLFLVGASAMWLPESVSITRVDSLVYMAGLGKTLERVNAGPLAAAREHGPFGFAVAALMGSQLARYLNARTP